MGRKYAYSGGNIGWALDECEERWFVAKYLEVASRIPADQGWKSGLENYFFFTGAGVGEVYLPQINQHRVRLGLEPIAFHETNPGEYARDSNRAYKAECRSRWRDEYLALDAPERADWVVKAEREIMALEPPHKTFEEYSAMRDTRQRGEQVGEDSWQAVSERKRREAAMLASERRAAEAAQSATTSKIIRQLKVASTLDEGVADDLIAEIVARIDPSAALDMAENLSDMRLRAALIRRSLEE